MMVNYSAFEINSCANDDFYRLFKADAFTVLSSVSPKIPLFTPTPNSYRIQPPIVSRREPSFVILQEVNSHRSSRESSPGGRVSPFRGCGFKPPFRESLPFGSSPDREIFNKIHRSRSSSSIALPKKLVRKMCKSVSPVRHKNSDVQTPMNKCTSCSTSRIIKSIFEINERYPPNNKTIGHNVSKNNLKAGSATKDRSKSLATSTHTERKLIVSRNTNITPRNLQTAFDVGGALTKKPTETKRQNFFSEIKPKSKENITNLPKCTLLSPVRATPENSSKVRSPSKNIDIRSKDNSSVFLRNSSPRKNKNLSHRKILENSTKTAAKAIEKPLVKMEECKDSAEISVPQTTPIFTTAKKSNVLAVTLETKEQRTCSEKSRVTRIEAEKRIKTSTLLNIIKSKPGRDKEKSISSPATDDKTYVVESAPSIEPSLESALTSSQPQSIPQVHFEVDDEKLCKKRQSPTNMHDLSELPPNFISSTSGINSSLLENSSTEEKTPKRTIPSLISNTERNSSLSFPVSFHLEPGVEGPEPGISSSNLNPSKFQRENQNRFNKSTSMSNQSRMKPPVMLSTEPFFVKHQSDVDPMKWKNLRSDNIRSVEVSGIGKKSNPVSNTSKKSYCKNYFCCFYRKLKNHHNTGSATDSSSVKGFPWFNCKNGFRNRLTVLPCSQKIIQLSSTEVKADPSIAHIVFLKLKGYACCKSIALNGSTNISIHTSLKNQFGEISSRCKKYLCFNFNKQILVLESEQQRSALPKTNHKRQKWTKIFTDFPKLDPSLIDHASVMRGAIPLLPLPLAWICLVLNVFLPGFGTLSSGVFCLFVGKPRFSMNDSLASRFASLFVNLLIAGSQLFTVLFCLVGWGWSIWWGVIMLRVARKSKRTMLPVQGSMETRSISVTNPNYDAEKGPNL